uniref:Tetratricopeptide repeat protein 36 n=1 Tax=Triatoma infestans TaxID=30076 RepID=A0A170Y7M4_TRIIF
MSGISLNDKAVLNCIFNPLLPVEDAILDEVNEEILKDDEIETEEVLKAKEIEFKGIQAAENGQVEEAIKLFTDALNVFQRASGYNNRAQAYRLLGKDEDALNDLNTALDISKEKGKSGCQALCQRGLLYRKKGQTDLAKSDFAKAAQLGSKFAKQQLVELNPYAAMCNQMLNEMMTKLTQIETHENGRV